jgi:hypothetical protein
MHLIMDHMPAINERLVLQDGMMNPVWFAWFKSLEKALHGVEVTSLIKNFAPAQLQDGATIRWDSGTQSWEISL